jgi:hypothetical protein
MLCPGIAVADDISLADLDEEWLLAKATSGLSDAQVEAFLEKVGSLWNDGWDNGYARKKAYELMFGDDL